MNLFATDFILVPINQNSHWTLIIVHIRERMIVYYDSCLNDGTVKMSLLLSYLCQEYYARIGKELNERQWQLRNAKDFVPQDNSYDCGIYICKFARNILKRDWDIWEMPAVRRHMLEELTQNHLILT